MTDAAVAVTELTERVVSLADGRQFEAPAVIDGRGDPGGGHLDVGFRSFVGQLVETEERPGAESRC